MRVPLVDLARQHESIAREVMPEVERVIAAQRFILGAPVLAFEAWLASYCGTKHAIGVASGSDALLLSLLALGIGPGDAVMTTPLTFVATAEAIARAGATPLFADVDPATLNIDPASVEALFASGVRAKAIVPVHLFGRATAMSALCAIAKKHGAVVIEDAAQAIGATSEDRHVGSIGDAGCFSFFPSKNLGAWGDGGAITTDDDAIATRLRSLRVHGIVSGEVSTAIGTNSRLDALQAAVLAVKARHLDAWTNARIAAASRYRALLAGVAALGLPREEAGRGHVYNQFVIRVPERDRVAARLRERGVETRAYYRVPLHRMPLYATSAAECPNADAASETLLALPIFPEITEAEQAYVAESLAASIA